MSLYWIAFELETREPGMEPCYANHFHSLFTIMPSLSFQLVRVLIALLAILKSVLLSTVLFGFPQAFKLVNN